MQITKNDKKTVRGWAMFDWANSVFSLVIVTAVFPPYFSSLAPEKMQLFGQLIDSDSIYSYGISFSFLILAFMSPILSGISDHSGRSKSFLKFFTTVGGLACMALFMFDSSETAYLGLIFLILGNIGFWGGLVFYNSYLPQIVTEDRFDQVSAKGYAYGYIGSVILLVIIIVMIEMAPKMGYLASDAIRLGFILVGLWWIGFAQFTFKVLPADNLTPFSKSSLWLGFVEVKDVYKQIKSNPNIFKFLLAYFLYIGGVNVVIYLATLFAQEELGFGQTELIVVVLILQLLAMIGAFFFAFVSEKSGNKLGLIYQVVIWVGICIAAYFVITKVQFYLLAIAVGLVFGGIQSLSRSTYTKMLSDDVDALASYYSFYDVLTKLAVVYSTFLFGLVNQLTGSMRNSIIVTGFFFLLGLIVLFTLKLEKKEAS